MKEFPRPFSSPYASFHPPRACFLSGMRAIAASAFMLGAASTEASPVPRAGSILNVDFGTTDLGMGEQGFNTFKVLSSGSAGPLTKNFGAYTVTVANGATVNSIGQLISTATLLSRDRLAPLSDSGSFTYNNLYRDMITGATTLVTQISGLSPNTPYTIVFHAYDNNNPGNVTFTNITGATPGSPAGAAAGSGGSRSPARGWRSRRRPGC